MLPEAPTTAREGFSYSDSESISDRYSDSFNIDDNHSISRGDLSAVDSMLAMSSPDRARSLTLSYEDHVSSTTHGLKRRREEEAFLHSSSGSSGGGGTALKRSHTLATIRESPSAASSLSSSPAVSASSSSVLNYDEGVVGGQVMPPPLPRGGHTLRRTVSEGRPGRPPMQSAQYGKQATLADKDRDRDKDKYGRSFL